MDRNENEFSRRKVIKLKRVNVIPGTVGTEGQPSVRCVRVMWINPYLMFLVFVLLVFGFSPPYQVITYVVAE